MTEALRRDGSFLVFSEGQTLTTTTIRTMRIAALVVGLVLRPALVASSIKGVNVGGWYLIEEWMFRCTTR